MKLPYRLYQLCVALPLGLVATLLTAVVVSLGGVLGGARFFGHYPPKWWSRFLLALLLLPVRVSGREHLSQQQSYVFVANHQGALDIFLVYGYLNRNFKWMMKKSLRRIPFVGYACQAAGHIFVDKSSRSAIQHTCDGARHVLRDGTSLTVFPEGARTFTGHMGAFRRGAFQLADELQLPVVPLTINGSFDALPRMRGFSFVEWHPLTLTIHPPIPPQGRGTANQQALLQQAYDRIKSALPETYQGRIENPDQ